MPFARLEHPIVFGFFRAFSDQFLRDPWLISGIPENPSQSP